MTDLPVLNLLILQIWFNLVILDLYIILPSFKFTHDLQVKEKSKMGQ